MSILKEIKDVYEVEKVSETYQEDVEITDLKEELGTKGHVLVVRGDKAYEDKLKQANLSTNLANPKFWLYENLINSKRIQEQLKKYPNHKLFDGVGFSALEALGFHANAIGRKAVSVMAYIIVPDEEVFDRYNIEVIKADGEINGFGEDGYVKKQAKVLSQRKDLIPCHQALYGAQSLAPIGNKVVNRLEELCIKPDVTSWCIASGSNLYGIGHKIKQRFPNCKTLVVEPETNITINPDLDLTNSKQIKDFANSKLRNYDLKDWDKHHSGIFPLHIGGANRYLLLLWASTGDIGFDKTIQIPTKEALKTREQLQAINPDYDWTKTTALTLNPAIELANQGKNVLVMSYGKYRENKFQDTIINGNEHNSAQKVD
jgi:hypothetical protein